MTIHIWRSRKTPLLALLIIFSAGNLCQVAGWGHLSSNDWRIPNKLQEVEVPVMDLETCQRNFLKSGSSAKVTRNTICAGRQGKDSCFVGFSWILFSSSCHGFSKMPIYPYGANFGSYLSVYHKDMKTQIQDDSKDRDFFFEGLGMILYYCH